jgi:GT2 family glycosyltransferase
MNTEAVRRLAAVIVNFRTPHTTIAAARSLQASHRRIHDVIVIENGSGDGSESVFQRELPGVPLVISQENRGFAGGCNLGLNEALRRGAHAVLLLNSDATVTESCVGALERELFDRPGRGIAGALILRSSHVREIESRGIRVSPGIGRVKLRDFGRPFDPRRLAPCERVPAVSGCAMLIRRDVVEQVGLLTEDYFWGLEDVDYCLAAASAGFEVVVVNDAIAFHEGSRSIGRRSAERVFWATRNHLLVLDRRAPRSRLRNTCRQAAVIALNLAYALTARDVPKVAGVLAVGRGAAAYFSGRRVG